MKKFLAIFMSMMLAFSLAACGGTPPNQPASAPVQDAAPADDAAPAPPENADADVPSTPDGGGKRVGVAMPTQSSQRWIDDGGNIKTQLEALGYIVDLQFAEDDVQAQVSQIENMITNGAECLVIASIDALALVNVLEQAKANNIPVIAYDRLLMNTDAVSYYATFDNTGVGVAIADYIEEKMDLANGAGPFNIEIFAGSPDDNNAHMFNNGFMSVIQKYLDNGQLVCRSGQLDFDQISTLRWSQEVAQQRMENIISANYSTGEDVDIVASHFDGLSYGIESALEGAGYVVGDERWPIITGQDAELMACKNILSGRQSQTIFKDTRMLAAKCVTMVQAVLEGTEPEINDTTTYDNGVIVVPSYLCEPISVDIDNMKSILVDDSGYYSAEEIGF
jgi:putative multiple sugar transport system substrate-binding protein